MSEKSLLAEKARPDLPLAEGKDNAVPCLAAGIPSNHLELAGKLEPQQGGLSQSPAGAPKRRPPSLQLG